MKESKINRKEFFPETRSVACPRCKGGHLPLKYCALCQGAYVVSNKLAKISCRSIFQTIPEIIKLRRQFYKKEKEQSVSI